MKVRLFVRVVAALVVVNAMASYVHLIAWWLWVPGMVAALLLGAWLVLAPFMTTLSVHEPLLAREDGSAMEGLHCCKYCGISETFWKHWPICRNRLPTWRKW